MRRAVLLLTIAAAAAGLGGVKAATSNDPYLWLDDVSSPRALQWVEAHNAKSTAVLEADPRYKQFYDQALDIGHAEDRIPVGEFIGGEIYNFWQDTDHVRGIWRRSSIESYASGKPQWETVLDLDALALFEKANWVWKGAQCSRPAERRCLINLSDGGEDAVTIREFDLPTKSFVNGGFVLPKGKQRVDWENDNMLLVSREWKKGDLGRTGYPFIAKRLKRGEPLSAAIEVYRGNPKDGGYRVTPFVLRDAQNRTLSLIDRPLDTWHSETYVLGPNGARRLAIPMKAQPLDIVDGQVIIRSQEVWAAGGKHFKAGSLLSLDLAQLKADPAHLKPALIYARGPREALEGASATRNVLLVSTLDNVRGRTLLFRPGPNGTWRGRAFDLPDNSTLGLADTSRTDDRALMTVTSFLTPPSLWLADAEKGTARQIIQQPAKFNASNLVAEQREAVSSDGTRIPYFLVHRQDIQDIKLDRNNPTLLYAYGGFEVSQTPSYSAMLGKLWLERGGVYALANIRGGGEFGPAWHEAGLGTRRQIIYDDFAAVGKALIATQVTSPRRLGIRGGSNGGLLMGVEFTQHPELWHSVVIDVPLLDMIRIFKIAAGLSWEGEYGSIDDPAVRAFWDKVSPYQNLRADKAYPTPFIFATTKDDRVGPQHARKFAARTEEMYLPFYYYENTEGGHAAGANLRQTARTNALEMTYLTEKLMDGHGPK